MLPSVLCLLVAGCAAQKALPPPVAARPLPDNAVVIASRRLAPAARRGEVLVALTGSAAIPSGTRDGYELVVQTADGRTLSCIARTAGAARKGAMVVLRQGAGCLPAAGQTGRSAP